MKREKEGAVSQKLSEKCSRRKTPGRSPAVERDNHCQEIMPRAEREWEEKPHLSPAFPACSLLLVLAIGQIQPKCREQGSPSGVTQASSGRARSRISIFIAALWGTEREQTD